MVFIRCGEDICALEYLGREAPDIVADEEGFCG
jgi:hypothetical protein